MLPALNLNERVPNLISTATIVLVLRLFAPLRGHAENRADVKYEHYEEEHGRIEVNTASVLFDLNLSGTLSLRGTAVYDGISGATPTGAPAPTPDGQVPLIQLEETRYAGTVEFAKKIGRYTVTPQIAYSTESDYESIGVALNQSLDFNQKNTTVTLGVSHNFDTLFPANSRLFTKKDKDTTDVMLGLTQILGPRSVLTANFTYGYAEGYLADPYKGFLFDYYPGGLLPEKRPDHKSREVGYLAITQFLDQLNASVEVSYRLHHDSFGIWAHTAGLDWFQKIGRHVVLSPTIRYYQQSAADFYLLSYPADPTFGDPVPDAYSADYRLTRLHTWTYGLKAVIKLDERFTIDAAFRRYEMHGDDGITAASAFPKANVFTLGASIWF